MTDAERITELESQVQFLVNFGVVDPELSAQLLAFWIGSFVIAHAVGRVVRAMGKH